jgi:hypothetical protein
MSKAKNPRDVNQIAFRTLQIVTGEIPNDVAPAPPPEKNPAAVALGKLGASKGGKARAEKLSEKRRSQIAKKAAAARWAKK